jgi:hypothetical protein
VRGSLVMQIEHEVFADVAVCARCRKRHDGILFKKLKNSIYSGPFETLTHWAMCPILNQPILMGHRDLSPLDRTIDR